MAASRATRLRIGMVKNDSIEVYWLYPGAESTTNATGNLVEVARLVGGKRRHSMPCSTMSWRTPPVVREWVREDGMENKWVSHHLTMHVSERPQMASSSDHRA